MGSGSAAVAAISAGRKFVGCEINPAHFETALRRIEAAHRQPRLFAEPAPRPVQEAML
jgi:DNA modification methylase